MKRIFLSFLTATCGLLSVSACTYAGGDIGDPLTRKLEWFSFINGDDMRPTCSNGSPDRYRLVYNGRYDQQVRIYETDALRRLLTVKVVNPADMRAIDPKDLAAPWRAKEFQTQLSQADYDALVGSFAASGVTGPVAVGLNLPSQSYYWTATSCVAGKMRVTGWGYPSPGFDGLAFPARLTALDPSGIPMEQARPQDHDPLFEAKAKRGEVTTFTLTIGADGLVR